MTKWGSLRNRLFSISTFMPVALIQMHVRICYLYSSCLKCITYNATIEWNDSSYVKVWKKTVQFCKLVHWFSR